MEKQLMDTINFVRNQIVYTTLSNVMGTMMEYLPEYAEALDDGTGDHTWPRPISEITEDELREIHAMCQKAMTDWENGATLSKLTKQLGEK